MYAFDKGNWGVVTNTVQRYTSLHFDSSKLQSILAKMVFSWQREHLKDRIDRSYFIPTPVVVKVLKSPEAIEVKTGIEIVLPDEFAKPDNVQYQVTLTFALLSDKKTFEIPSCEVLMEGKGPFTFTGAEIKKKFKVVLTQPAQNDVDGWRKMLLQMMMGVHETAQDFLDKKVGPALAKDIQQGHGGAKALPTNAGRPSTKQQTLFASNKKEIGMNRELVRKGFAHLVSKVPAVIAQDMMHIESYMKLASKPAMSQDAQAKKAVFAFLPAAKKAAFKDYRVPIQIAQGLSEEYIGGNEYDGQDVWSMSIAYKIPGSYFFDDQQAEHEVERAIRRIPNLNFDGLEVQGQDENQILVMSFSVFGASNRGVTASVVMNRKSLYALILKTLPLKYSAIHYDMAIFAQVLLGVLGKPNVFKTAQEWSELEWVEMILNHSRHYEGLAFLE